MKFSPETARVVADNPYKGALNDVSFVVKFVSKNKMGKQLKFHLYKISIYNRTILLIIQLFRQKDSCGSLCDRT